MYRMPPKPEAVKGSLSFEDESLQESPDASSVPAPGNQPGPAPSLQPMDLRTPKKSRTTPMNQFKEEFHVFAWLNSRNGSQHHSLDASAVNVNYLLSGFESQGVQDDLAEIDNYLTKETTLNHRLIYNRAPGLENRADIYRRLSELKPDAESTEEHIIARYETSAGIVNAAELLYRFFLPSDYQAPTIAKFWGTFARLFRVRHTVRF